MKPLKIIDRRLAARDLLALGLCFLFAPEWATGQLITQQPARVVTEYALTSAQDYSNQDPAAWRLLGSNDGGHSWTVLDAQTNQVFKSRSQRRLYPVRNHTAYNAYRLQLEDTIEVALGELELMGPVVGVQSEADLRSEITASGEHPLLAPATQAFDGDPTTKWVDFGTAGATPPWIQCQYTRTNERVLRSIGEFLVVARRKATDNRLQERAPEILSKLVAADRSSIRPLTGYALTSANDAPARDPRDWKLLGSDDGGRSWTVLDERRNESFARRLQRRVFTLSKPAACALYRLRIESIRVPGGVDADSVQLAEIQPIYAAEVPKGPFSIIVSAQGENPPMELAEKAFDGDVRTKWLDFGETGGPSGSNTNRSSWIEWQYLADVGAPVISLRWLRTVRSRPPQPIRLRLEGVAAYWRPDTQTLGLLDDTGFQAFKLEHPIAGIQTGDRVLLEGQPRFDGGIPLALQPQCVRLGPLSTLPEIKADQILAPEDHFLLGTAEGTVEAVSEGPDCTDARLKLENSSGTLVVKMLNGGPTRTSGFPGYQLRAQGVVQVVYNEEGKRVPGLLWVSDPNHVTWGADTAPTKERTAPKEGNTGSEEGQPVTGTHRVYDLIQQQPGKAFPVSIRGVITYIDPGLNYFYVQDGSDGVQVNGLLGAGLAPSLQQEGLYVEVQGVVATNELAVNATGKARVLGRGQMPEPARHSWEYLITGEDFGRWVEIDGVVREVDEHRLILLVGGGKLIVWINELDKREERRLLGSLVRVRGVCAPAVNNRNRRFGIRLLVTSMESLEVLKAVPDDPFDLPLRPIARLMSLGAERGGVGTRLIKTSGVVTYQAPRLLFVQDGEDGLSVSLRKETALEPGERVEVVGFVEPDGLSPKLVQALVRRAGRGSLPPVRPLDLLDTDSSSPDALWGQLEARLLGRSTQGSVQVLELRDIRSDTSFSALFPTNRGTLPPLAIGSRLRLRGVLKAELGDLPDVGQAVTSFLLYGNSPTDVTILEQPTWWTIRHTYWMLAALGSVLFVSLAWVVLLRSQVRVRTSELRSQIEERKQAEEALHVSRARLQLQFDRMPVGCITWSPEFRVTSWNPAAEKIFGYRADEVLGKHPFDLIVPSEARAHVEQVWCRLAGSERDMNSVNGNVTKDGRTILCDWTNVPLRSANGDVLSLLSMVQDVTDRKKAEAELAYERDLLNTLLESVPVVIYFKDRESRFVRYSKSFTQLFRLNDPQELKGKTDFDFFAEDHARHAYDDEQEILRTGKPLVGKIERETHLDGRVTWALTSKMPWRNPEGQLIGTFGVSQNITAIKEAEAKLETAHRDLVRVARQAGMAEVATSVLHNVGNVLNSVNVCSGLIASRLRRSKVSSLVKTVGLLRQHREDLGAFLTMDPKGKQIPTYLEHLAEYLSSEQSGTIEELQNLTRFIEHIKDIVAMQQSYAKVSGVVERVRVSDLLEDALRINAGALERHNVTVVRQYADPVPEVILDKHKVLQILVNLIRNAKYACEESAKCDKAITVRVDNGGGRVKISVVDNGVGIAPENLARIFNLGFTTRKEGHGFGLHNSALAAREVGGALSVQSDGPGEGAIFTLELPIEWKQQHA